MDDELNLEELDQIEANAENKLKVKNRFEQLSEKVKVTSQERDAEAEARKKAEEEKASIEKDRDFYKNFSTLSSKYPAAAEYQETIREKVNAGYTEEDAVLAVLAKEGKLAGTPNPPQHTETPEGGSAPTIQVGEKSIADMTLEEKRAALEEADISGELANALLGRK